jgi:hypothetical protein
MALTHTPSVSSAPTFISPVRPPSADLGAREDYSSAQDTNYVPIIFTNKVLRNFYESSVFAQICNTDYEGEIKSQGDKVVIRKTPDMTVKPYAVGTIIDYEIPQKDSTELMVDLGMYSAFQIDDVDKAQSDLPLINMFAKDAGERIRIETDREILTYLSDGANATNKGATAGAITASVNLGVTTAPVTITSTNATEFIVLMNQVLDEANIPMEGRWCVVPAAFCAALKTSDLKAANITGDSTGVIRTGLIGMVDRMKIYQNNNLATGVAGGLAAGETAIICGTSEGATFAANITKTDTVKIPNSFGEYWRTLFVYGRGVVQDTALVNAIVNF